MTNQTEGKKGTQKALAARKAALKGPERVKTRRAVPSETPSLTMPRAPVYPRKSTPKKPRLTDETVLKHPKITPTTKNLIETQRTLTFIVDILSNKPQIKRVFEKTYDVKVLKVNTMITPQGEKKAYIRLAEGYDAEELANKAGFL